MVVESLMMPFEIVKIVKENSMSIRLAYFHIQSIMLLHEQLNSKEHYS